MNQLIVNNILIDRQTIRYSYDVQGQWAKCFNRRHPLEVEYSMDISTLPPSIAIIPLLVNVLPVSWILDATIYVEEVDMAFYHSIKDFKQGLADMYPMLDFKGNLIFKHLVDNSFEPSGEIGLLFSGGFDSVHALLSIHSMKPTLITLIGADVKETCIEGITNLKALTHDYMNQYDVEGVFIHSNFRTMFHHQYLDIAIEAGGRDWWYGFQHGIGMIGLAAPYTYIGQWPVLYRSSSYVTKDLQRLNVRCASVTGIDDQVKMASTSAQFLHDDLSRRQRILEVVEYARNNNTQLNTNVCWKNGLGRNCCYCEKCIKTIILIISAGGDPADFGFDEVNYDFLRKTFLYKIIINDYKMDIWLERQTIYRQNMDRNDPEGRLSWFGTLDFTAFNKKPLKRIKRLIRSIRKLIKRIVYKL